MSKIILDNSSSSSSSGSYSSTNKADYLVASLHRYDWLSKYSIQLCRKKSLDIDTVFGAEVKICNDMVELLPSKIDRMHFHGESGLTIWCLLPTMNCIAFLFFSMILRMEYWVSDSTSTLFFLLPSLSIPFAIFSSSIFSPLLFLPYSSSLPPCLIFSFLALSSVWCVATLHNT